MFLWIVAYVLYDIQLAPPPHTQKDEVASLPLQFNLKRAWTVSSEGSGAQRSILDTCQKKTKDMTGQLAVCLIKRALLGNFHDL